MSTRIVTGVMGADQALGTPSQWDALASVSLDPGTWLLSGMAQLRFTSGTDTASCDLFDGTSGHHLCQRKLGYPSAVEAALATYAVLALAATTTISLRAQSANGAVTAVASRTVGSGNPTDQTQLTATRVLGTVHEAELSADIALASNVWAEGPNLNLGPGTWLVVANAQFEQTASCSSMAELFDGMTEYGFAEYSGGTGELLQVSMATPIVLANPTTLRLRLATDGGATAKAALLGEQSTFLVAIEV